MVGWDVDRGSDDAPSLSARPRKGCCRPRFRGGRPTDLTTREPLTYCRRHPCVLEQTTATSDTQARPWVRPAAAPYPNYF